MKDIKFNISVIIIFFILFFQSLPAVAQTADNDVIMANIELMNRRISSLNNSLNNYNNRLKSLNNKINELEDIIERSNIELSVNLLKLKTDYLAIKKEYSSAIHSIDSIFTIDRKFNNRKFIKIENQLITISHSIDSINSGINKINQQLCKIPSIYFKPYDLPSARLGVAANKFFTYNQNRINVSAAFDFNAAINIIDNFYYWVNYTSPFVLTISYIAGDNIHKISDRWNAMIFSSGLSYTMFQNRNKSVGLEIESGLFYGKVVFDDYYNTTLNTDRTMAKGIETSGVVLNIGISYNQYFYKNPFAVFLNLNNHISFKNIILQSDNQNKFDFGAYLFSLSAGLRFCLW